MNSDIRLSVGFWQHPKTYRLEKRLGLKGIRSLQILWCWAAQNRPDGDLSGFDAGDLEFVADWRGKKGAFAEACVACGWIEQTGAGFSLHEWADYNPYQAMAESREEARREKARMAANARWGRQANSCSNDATGNAQNDAGICSNDAQAYANSDSGICSNDANAMQGQCSNDAPSNAQAMPSLTLTSTKEFKESSLRSDSFCAEQKSSALHAEKLDDAVISLPLNTGEPFPVSRDMAGRWSQLYPGTDVMQALRSMAGWLEANPRKRKTRRGILNFVNGWLSREQDRGARASPGRFEGRAEGDIAAMKTLNAYERLREQGLVS